MSGLDPVLTRGLLVIEPYLGDVVLAGGWVPHIYELLHDANAISRSPRTRDIDLAVPRFVAVRGESIDQLLTTAHFECRFSSVSTPPITKYVAADDDQEIEIEFITDAPGGAEDVVSVQAGLTAQELHYVGLLLEAPWPVDRGEITGGRVELSILVPNPAAFVFHKSLVFKKRKDPRKAEKDLYYIFFVLDTFPEWKPSIAAGLERLAQERRAWFRKACGYLTGAFADDQSVGVDALLAQRPETAFPSMNDEQFRQYGLSAMSELVAIMDAALSDNL